MALMNKEDMMTYLNEMNNRLADVNLNGEIIMTGGAVVTLVHGERDATMDFDVVFTPKEEIRDIIKDIANKYDLDNDWMNNGVEPCLTPAMKFNKFLELSNLTVYNMDDESMLALKLVSARPLPSHDMNDSIFFMKKLNIRSVEQALDIIEKYTDPIRLTPAVRYFTIDVFENYSKYDNSMHNKNHNHN